MLGYCKKELGGVFGGLANVRASRRRPQIPTQRVVKALFLMHIGRSGSLNMVEQTGRRASWQRLLGGRLPSADTLARVASLVDPDDLRKIHHTVYSQLKRNKALPAPPHGLTALVLDGHESTASYRRRCAGCLTRVVHTKSGDREQCYHRYVAASLVGDGFHHFLDVEEVRPGEDEIAAATRLLERVHAAYPRAYDIVLGDALYAQAPFFQRVAALGKQTLAVLKQESRDLYKDVMALCELQEPQRFERTCRDGTVRKVQCWDFEGLTSWPSLGRPVRVIRTIETWIARSQKTKQLEEHTAEWMWVTTVDAAQLPTQAAVELAHTRWDIENQGFNEAVTHWHLDHVYRHEPAAMRTIVLLGMLAINVMNAFYRRSVKPTRRLRESKLFVMSLVQACLLLLPPGRMLAPD